MEDEAKRAATDQKCEYNLNIFEYQCVCVIACQHVQVLTFAQFAP